MAGEVLHRGGSEGTTWTHKWISQYSFHQNGTVVIDMHEEMRFTSNDKYHREDYDKDTTEEYRYIGRVDFWGNAVVELQNGEEREYEIMIDRSNYPVSLQLYTSPLDKFLSDIFDWFPNHRSGCLEYRHTPPRTFGEGYSVPWHRNP